MTRELVDIVERDLREVIEMEFSRFRGKFKECKKVDIHEYELREAAEHIVKMAAAEEEAT
jgi:hypothetical protein